MDLAFPDIKRAFKKTLESIAPLPWGEEGAKK